MNCDIWSFICSINQAYIKTEQPFGDGYQLLAEADPEVCVRMLSARLGVGQVTKTHHAHSKYLQKCVIVILVSMEELSSGKYGHAFFLSLHNFRAHTEWN